MSGFEPPTGRRSYIDQGFVPPNRQQHIQRPPIKHFSSGNSIEGSSKTSLPLPPPPQQSPAPQPQSSSGSGVSVFSSFFRKRSNPPASTTTSEPSPTSSGHHNAANQGGPNNNPSGPGSASSHAPQHPRRLSSRELNPISGSGLSSAHTSSSHEVMLVDPYSMPRDAPDSKPSSLTSHTPTPTTATTSSPARERPSHASTPSTSSVATTATTATAATARPRGLHPELRSLISLNAARELFISPT